MSYRPSKHRKLPKSPIEVGTYNSEKQWVRDERYDVFPSMSAAVTHFHCSWTTIEDSIHRKRPVGHVPGTKSAAHGLTFRMVKKNQFAAARDRRLWHKKLKRLRDAGVVDPGRRDAVAALGMIDSGRRDAVETIQVVEQVVEPGRRTGRRDALEVPETKESGQQLSGKSIWERVFLDVLQMDWNTITPADQEQVQQEFDRSGVTSPREWLSDRLNRQAQHDAPVPPHPVDIPPAPAKGFEAEFREVFGPAE